MNQPNKFKYSTRDIYNELKPEIKDLISASKFTSICKDFNTIMMNKVIEEGLVFNIPFLGQVMIKKRKIQFQFNSDGTLKEKYTKAGVNWKLTKELWASNAEAKKRKQLVWNTNDHTEGWKYRFYWAIPNISNISAFKLKITRTHDRKLAQVLKSNNYPEYYI